MNTEQFACYIEEFHEFSASHGVPFGSPEDLRGLLLALSSDETFFEECASMLRSVVYRERGEANATALLMLVATVWSGPGVETGGALTEETEGHLRRFVCGAMRVPQISGIESTGEDVVDEASSSAVVAVTDDKTEAVPWVTEGYEAGAGRQQEGDVLEANAHPVLSTIEAALCELEVRSPEVRLYRRLLQQREEKGAPAGLGRAEPEAATVEPEITERQSEEPNAPWQTAFAAGFDPWDESSDLQKELRRFSAHRERALAREAERASRPLHAKLLRGAESALAQLLGKDHLPGRGLGRRGD